MKAEHKAALRELRSMGYAVVVFTPEELDGLTGDDARTVEERMTDEGWDAIECLKQDRGVPMPCDDCQRSYGPHYSGCRC